jgi:hypothetical protein
MDHRATRKSPAAVKGKATVAARAATGRTTAVWLGGDRWGAGLDRTARRRVERAIGVERHRRRRNIGEHHGGDVRDHPMMTFG